MRCDIISVVGLDERMRTSGGETGVFLYCMCLMIAQVLVIGGVNPTYYSQVTGYVSSYQPNPAPVSPSSPCAWWQVGIFCSAGSTYAAIQNGVTSFVWYVTYVFHIITLPFYMYGLVVGIEASYSIWFAFVNTILILVAVYTIVHGML